MNVNTVEAGYLKAGMEMLTETNLPLGEGVLSFQIVRNRELRKALKNAGFPLRATVISTGRVADEPSDVRVTLDFGNEQVQDVTFHRERMIPVAN